MRTLVSISSTFGLIAFLIAGGVIHIFTVHRWLYFGFLVLIAWICFMQAAIEYMKMRKGVE